jgi:hypothetical protein
MEDSPFGNPIHLGYRQEGGINAPLGAIEPLDDYAIYTNWPWIQGPLGTFLLARGTKAEITRLHRHWTTNPEAFDRFAFANRR